MDQIDQIGGGWILLVSESDAKLLIRAWQWKFRVFRARFLNKQFNY